MGAAIDIAGHLLCGQEDTTEGQNDICGDQGITLLKGGKASGVRWENSEGF